MSLCQRMMIILTADYYKYANVIYKSCFHLPHKFIVINYSNAFSFQYRQWMTYLKFNKHWGHRASWSYGSCIYNYLCNRCLPPIALWVRILLMARCTRYNIIWWSLPVTCFSVYSSSFPNKTERHNIAEILLKVTLDTTTLTLKYTFILMGVYL